MYDEEWNRTMKKIILTIIPNEDKDYDTCLLTAQKIRNKSLIGYASVKIDEIEDKAKREEE